MDIFYIAYNKDSEISKSLKRIWNENARGLDILYLEFAVMVYTPNKKFFKRNRK